MTKNIQPELYKYTEGGKTRYLARIGSNYELVLDTGLMKLLKVKTGDWLLAHTERRKIILKSIHDGMAVPHNSYLLQIQKA